MSIIYGPTPPTRAESARATWRTAQVMADPDATMADRLAAAEAEAAAITARRHQPETEGARADLDAGLGDFEAGQ